MTRARDHSGPSRLGEAHHLLPGPLDTKGTCSTKVVNRGTEVTLNVCYRDSRIKEQLKEGQALCIEFVWNVPGDVGCERRLTHLPELHAIRCQEPLA
jgi:hypothetical protein